MVYIAKGYTNLFRCTDQHLSKQKNEERQNEMSEGSFCYNVPAGPLDMMDHPEEEQSLFIPTPQPQTHIEDPNEKVCFFLLNYVFLNIFTV